MSLKQLKQASRDLEEITNVEDLQALKYEVSGLKPSQFIQTIEGTPRGQKLLKYLIILLHIISVIPGLGPISKAVIQVFVAGLSTADNP